MSKICVHGIPGDELPRMMCLGSAGESVDVKMLRPAWGASGEPRPQEISFTALYFETDGSGVRHYRISPSQSESVLRRAS